MIKALFIIYIVICMLILLTILVGGVVCLYHIQKKIDELEVTADDEEVSD